MPPEPTVLVMPGYEDSGPEHWQSRWCRAHPEYRRIAGLDWNRPVRRTWVRALDAAVRAVDGSVVVVAHSLGSVTVACLGTDAPPNLVAALLVTPCDSEQRDFPEAIRGFAPMPTGRLPFRTLVVASHDDPWMTLERAARFADAWGSELVDAGAMRHLNTESGHGPWPAGEKLLDDLVRA